MLRVYPDYYKEFKCIADKCRHSCCIGWEIDIDENTLEFYSTVKGDMGARLKNGIEYDENGAHFLLTENERCPFLNEKGLCDIITELGEEHISDICTMHPRFVNDLPSRQEIGIGLCCEEAARIIIGKKSKTMLILEGENDDFDEIVNLRDRAVAAVQERSLTMEKRLKNMLSLFGSDVPEFRRQEIADLLLSLERLDESWTKLLELYKNTDASLSDFSSFMKGREHEYEQLLVYLIYRHMANAPDVFEAGLRAKLTWFVYELIKGLGAAIFADKGSFDFWDQTELMRLFSSEIEYSDENLDIIYDYLTQL